MADKSISCSFTGHRIIEKSDKERLNQFLPLLLSSLYDEGIRHFITGGALGFDTAAAQCVLLLRETHPDITLELALPCENQTKGWRDADICVYEKIKELADSVTMVSEKYFSGCMHKRNRYMVDSSSVLVAYLNRFSGGTAYTVKYAEGKDIKIINLGSAKYA